MVEVVTLGGADVDRAVPPLVRAFWSFPETVHLLPSEAVRRRVLPRYLASDARDAARYGTLLGARTAEGSIVGAATWLPPHAYPVSTLRSAREAARLLPALPWALSALREAQRGQAANRNQHRCFPPHYWLRAIGVDPAAQHTGIGTALIAPILRLADQTHRGCFLFTATADNVSWYRRFGFTESASYRPTATWPMVWALWREPHPDASSLEARGV